ncbi:MAG: hypothetical protein HXY50_13145 [Ignavibacteriaceae bacterium]|nr:hypothetical protein [Ignavibacteriaceae bacterium]
MAVNLNSIGNYNSKLVNTNYRNAEVKTKAAAEKEKINTEEKKFFAKLYPDKGQEIMNYSFYERSGKMNGVSVGTNFDKKG